MDVFPPLIGQGAVDGTRMESTLELSGGRGTGIHDVTGLLRKYGCSADDIKSISRLEHGRPGTYEVGFCGVTSLKKFLKEGGEGLSYRSRSFSFLNLGSQNVTIRVHWLPSYIKDDVVWKMFRRFGDVESVVREKSKFDIFEVETGVRLVKMVLSADDIKCLPHILTFRCGTRALVSVPGRPPLCLKCMTVGHVRRDCGADTGARRLVSAPAPPTRDEGNAWQRQEGRPPAQEVATQEVTPVVAVTDAAAPAEEAAPPEQREDGDQSSPVSETSVVASPIPSTRRSNRGEKRQAADDEVRDSFTSKIPPNKYIAGTTGVPETSNPFDVLGLLSDEDSLPGDLMIDMDM